eukprot:g11403.t1
MSVDTERLVLSEVHVGSSTEDEEEVVSRYTYLTPPPRCNTSTTAAAQDARAGTGRNADESRSDSDDSSSSGGDSEEDGYSRVKRHRKRLRTSSQRRRPAHEVLTVVHRMATTLGLVGQQVWSAAFLLSDFVLTHEDIFAGKQVLELGAGPGVVGLIAARVAKRCYLTDYHPEVLKLLARNAEANRHLFAVGGSPTPARASATIAGSSSRGGAGDFAAEGGTSRGGGEGGCVLAVRELDWFTFSREEGSAVSAGCDPAEDGQDRDRHSSSSSEGEDSYCAGMGSGLRKSSDVKGTCRPFSWRKHELEGLSASTSTGGELVLVAADVIYDEGLTDAFFDVLRMLMPTSAPPSSGAKLADGCSGGVTPSRVRVDQTPPAHSASGNSDGSEAAATIGGSCSTSCQKQVVSGADGGKERAVLYLALEKRFNFSMAELSVAATGYSALLRNVLDTTPQRAGSGRAVADSFQRGEDVQKDFEGRRLPLLFKQCFQYQRNDAMELWEIRRRPGSSHSRQGEQASVTEFARKN